VGALQIKTACRRSGVGRYGRYIIDTSQFEAINIYCVPLLSIVLQLRGPRYFILQLPSAAFPLPGQYQVSAETTSRRESVRSAAQIPFRIHTLLPPEAERHATKPNQIPNHRLLPFLLPTVAARIPHESPPHSTKSPPKARTPQNHASNLMAQLEQIRKNDFKDRLRSEV
jgi:hypothetical protein